MWPGYHDGGVGSSGNGMWDSAVIADLSGF